MTIRRIARLLPALAVALTAGQGVVLRSQAPEPQVFREGVEAVHVTIHVSGRNGRPPRLLQRSDFRVSENGKEQAITVFASEQLSESTRVFTIGYTSRTPATTKRKVEVRIRGFRKRITRTLEPEAAAPAVPR